VATMLPPALPACAAGLGAAVAALGGAGSGPWVGIAVAAGALVGADGGGAAGAQAATSGSSKQTTRSAFKDDADQLTIDPRRSISTR
jgi:hypothetical protein